jgi:hypothetical protein
VEDQFAVVFCVATVQDLVGVNLKTGLDVFIPNEHSKVSAGIYNLLDKETVPGGTASCTSRWDREKACRKPDMAKVIYVSTVKGASGVSKASLGYRVR